MSGALRWCEGEPAVRRALEDWCAGRLAAACLRESPRRRILRLDAPGAGPLLLKHFRAASGRRPGRGRLRGRLGIGPAHREWRHLAALRRAGVPVPEPLGRAALAGGDLVVATRWIEGEPLLQALGAGAPGRRAVLASLGRAVAALHAAGFVHRDLHHGNVLVADGQAWLLDVQRARRSRRQTARLADLGWLDCSLWGALSRPDRLRLWAAALGLERPFGPRARGLLRAVGRAARLRGRRHARSRTRRSLRPGRLYARAAAGDLRGMRLRALEPGDLAVAAQAHAAALAAGDSRVLKDDGRSRITAVAAGARAVVVKEAPPRGALRALADALRGSAARRAWLGGHGLAARGIGAARPLAFLERRILGVPVASWLVLEDLRPAEAADACRSLETTQVALALGRLALALHRREVDHGDLKASHVYLRPGASGVEARVLDLDGVRFPRRLSDARRLRALAQLNASLPDRFPAEARRLAFRRYAAALPFRGGPDLALRRVVALSLARRHRWTGRGCALADSSGASPGPTPA